MNSRLEKYKGFCTEEYLMGPNSLQLLNEMMNKVSIKENSRILDLGAGKKNFFEEKILPFLKKDGLAIIAMPGLKKELSDNYPDLMVKWFEEDYDELNKFHCRKWWLELLDNYEEYEIVEEFDLDCFYEAWEDWFNCGHEFGKKDKEFFMKGLGEYLSFIGLVIKKK